MLGYTRQAVQWVVLQTLEIEPQGSELRDTIHLQFECCKKEHSSCANELLVQPSCHPADAIVGRALERSLHAAQLPLSTSRAPDLPLRAAPVAPIRIRVGSLGRKLHLAGR